MHQNVWENRTAVRGWPLPQLGPAQPLCTGLQVDGFTKGPHTQGPRGGMVGAVSQPGGSTLTLTGTAHLQPAFPAPLTGRARPGRTLGFTHLSVTHSEPPARVRLSACFSRNPCETLLSIQPLVDAKRRGGEAQRGLAPSPPTSRLAS